MKDINNYEGLYQVTENGDVWSVRRNRFLKQGINMYGYKYVVLYKNNKQKNFLVHRLVAEAFLEIPKELRHLEGTLDLQVNHKDECKTNNNVNNLEWCDRKYNINYGTGVRRSYLQRCKPVLQFTLDGQFVREWESANEAGRNGFQTSSVNRCCQGKYKKHNGFIFKYKD